MSATENTKFQVNFKTPAGTLINVYGDTVVDAIALMNEMAAAAGLIKTIEQHLAGAPAPAAAPAAPAPVLERAPWETSAPAAAAPVAAAPAQSGNSCKHGAMVYREGTGKRGPWRAYFCPAPKGAPDQCDPHFLG